MLNTEYQILVTIKLSDFAGMHSQVLRGFTQEAAYEAERKLLCSPQVRLAIVLDTGWPLPSNTPVDHGGTA